MKEFWARLNSTERRFVVGVAVVFFLVINIVWVWPHFGDWSETTGRMAAARTRLVTFESGTNLIPDLTKQIDKYQGQGQIVPEENQALQFSRLVMSQTTLFGIIPQNVSYRRESGPTNSFFVEQSATMTLDTTEKPLVDFLYSIGAGTNLTRIKVLSVQPDGSHQRLNARATLVASYQKSPIGPAGAAPAVGQKPTAPQPKAGPAPKNAKPGPTPNNSKPGSTPGNSKPSPAPAPNKPSPGGLPPNTPRPGQFVPPPSQSMNQSAMPGANYVIATAGGPQKNLTPNKK